MVIKVVAKNRIAIDTSTQRSKYSNSNTKNPLHSEGISFFDIRRLDVARLSFQWFLRTTDAWLFKDWNYGCFQRI